jgi:hypothetical protein
MVMLLQLLMLLHVLRWQLVVWRQRMLLLVWYVMLHHDYAGQSLEVRWWIFK